MQISGFSPVPHSLGASSAHRQAAPNAPEKAHSPTPHSIKKTGESTPQTSAQAKKPTSTQLNEEEQKQLRELQRRDQEVRAHEAAHKAVAGQLARGATTYSYQRGPDGQLYAVGGEVSIDTNAVSNDPEATLQKAEQIRAAALAPAQPSGQDLAVASAAAAMAAEARAELAANQQAEFNKGNEETDVEARNSSPANQYNEITKAENSRPSTIDLMA